MLEKLNKMGFVRREGIMESKRVRMVGSVIGIIVSVFVSACHHALVLLFVPGAL